MAGTGAMMTACLLMIMTVRVRVKVVVMVMAMSKGISSFYQDCISLAF